MLKRFFIIMNRSWTFEMEYYLEIIRLMLINVLTICLLSLSIKLSVIPIWLKIVAYVFVPVYWLFYSRYSIGRMVQIHNNKKYARVFKAAEIEKIFELFPNQPLYTKINNKYKKIVKGDCVDDKSTILLITIGKKSISEYKKLKRL